MIFAQSYKNLSYLQKKKEDFSSFIKEKQYLCTLIIKKYDMPQTLHIAIIGGGAAGFFAAIEAKRNFPHADITILEKNSKVLAKVEITGGGRCNLTNSFDEISDLKQAYPRGHKLMKRLFKRFDYQHAFDWFEENGVPLVTQEDQCVFPQSQDSHSIIDCLVNTAKRLGVKIQCNHQLTAITELEDERLLLEFKISKEKGNLSGASSASHPVSEIRQIAFHRVAITTGGHPKIENFKHLSDLGHAIEQPIPSLFTLNIADKAFKNLMGTVVEPVYTSIPGTKLKAEGPLLITHWGMSGPAVLKLSSHAARYLHENNYQIKISVNWVHESNRSLVEENIQGIIIANPQK
jgi:predicted Rossmann fold flavoprotein